MYGCPHNILDHDFFSQINSRNCSPDYHNCGHMWCDYNCTTHCYAVWGHLCCVSILEEGHFNVCYNMFHTVIFKIAGFVRWVWASSTWMRIVDHIAISAWFTMTLHARTCNPTINTTLNVCYKIIFASSKGWLNSDWDRNMTQVSSGNWDARQKCIKGTKLHLLLW